MKKGKKLILENLLYEENITERLHPKLEEDLRESRHSLSECGVFPEGDEMTSEMKLIRGRFQEVVNRCRAAFDVNKINNSFKSSSKYSQNKTNNNWIDTDIRLFLIVY